MIHSFSAEVAQECGILAAVIFHNLGYWCAKNEANEEHYHDGRYWTYNSKAAFAKLFPYATEKQVRTALQTLRDSGLIEAGCYNKSPYDRTLWYAISDKGKAYDQWSGLDQGGRPIGPEGPTDWPSRADLSDQEGQPIPDNKPDNKQADSKPDSKESAPTEEPKKKPERKPKEPKHKYGEYGNVLLTDAERERLAFDFGDYDTMDAIKFLDEYIEEKGTKYKNHNLTLRRWVFQAVKERREREKKAKGGPAGYDWDNL